MKRIVSFLILAALPLLAFAGSQPRYSGSDWTLLDRSSIVSAAAGITLKAYPNCDTAVVDQRSVRVYRADGTGECQDETYTKILTEKGRRGSTTMSFSYDIPYTSVQVVKLEILDPDGTAHPVDVAANSRDSIDQSQMESNIYDPDSRVLTVNIPHLGIGQIIHSVVRTTIERPIIAGEFADDELFEGDSFIRHISLVIHGPAAKPLVKIALRNEVPGTVKASTATEADGGLVYRWEVSDVPRMFDEPDMPPAIVVLQHLSVSTTPSWKDVSRWYWNISKAHLEAVSPQLKEKVATLIAGKTDDMAKIKALFYYVSRNIRYMGITPEKDRPGFEPHDVSMTFSRKYGVCRDKAALLVSMLRLAGFPAYPVLESYGVKKDPDIPNPDFNHAIVAIDRGAAGYLLMDPTDENTRDLLPALEGNQSYLVCRPEGDVLRTTPVNDPNLNLMRINTTASMDANGRIVAKSHLEFDGINDNAYRQTLLQMKRDERWRVFEAIVKHAIPGAIIQSLEIHPDNLLDAATPLSVDMTFAVPSAAAFGRSCALVDVPWVGNRTGIINFILRGAGLDHRKYPLDTLVTCGISEHVTLHLDRRFVGALSLPKCEPEHDECLDYQRSYSLKDGTLVCDRELKTKLVEFSPAEYLRLKRILAVMDTDDRKAPLLELASGPALAGTLSPGGVLPPPVSDTHIVDVQKDLVVKDAHDATLTVHYVKKVLTYSGKKREAEVKIPYNPATEEVHLVSATVTAADGHKETIAPEELNIMDQGWDSSAKRYTGGKILVASLPGVEIGSVIDLTYRVRIHDRPYLSGVESFQLGDVCDSKTFRLTAPAELPILRHDEALTGVVQATAVRSGPLQIHEWQGKHLPATPTEWSTPPDWAFRPSVSFVIGNPAHYLDLLEHDLVAHAMKDTRAAAVAKSLAGKAKSPEGAILAIRNYVATSVRLAGPSFDDLPLSELSDADTTLADGYGHGADRAILLYGMLRTAGFKPRFVLASGLPALGSFERDNEHLALLGEFHDVLVQVPMASHVVYLNDTDQYAHLGATAHDGAMGILLTNGTPLVVKAAPGAKSKSEEDYAISVSGGGRTRIAITRRFYGTVYGAQKKFFTELPPEQRDRYFQEVVASVSQGARPVGGLVTRFDRYPGIESFTVDVDSYAIHDGQYLYFDLPASFRLFPTATDLRAQPFYLPTAVSRIVHSEITFPSKDWRVLISPGSRKAAAVDHSGGVRIVSRDEPGRLVIDHTLSIKPSIVAAADYPALVTLENSLENESSRAIVIDTGIDAAPAAQAPKAAQP